MPSRLTDADRDLIARARKMADLRGLDAIREHTGVGETDMAYAIAFGEAQHLLSELAIRLLTLGGL